MITLNDIVQHQRQRVAESKLLVPKELLQSRIAVQAKPIRDFVGAISSTNSNDCAVIAECKMHSPSEGDMRRNRMFEGIVVAYTRGGAKALSVITEPKFFQGDPSFIRRAKQETPLPILRKDFIIDAYQVYETRAIGADAMLLIAAILSPAELIEFSKLAHELGLQTLIEIHTTAELEAALAANPTMLGINTRDLTTMTVDLKRFEAIAEIVPKDTVLIAESGIKTKADVAYVQSHGARAVLVGTTLMRADNPELAVRSLL